jgi:hypothetical protein
MRTFALGLAAAAAMTVLPADAHSGRERTDTAFKQCAANATLVGQCEWKRGRLQVNNGNPSVRLWIVGTRRMKGVYDAGGRDEFPLPEDLKQSFGSDPFATYVYGTYRVCPLEPDRPGNMQAICIAGARNLVSRPMR